MKQLFRKSIQLLLLLLISSGGINAIDVGANFQIGNLGFTNTSASDASTSPILYPWGLTINANQQITESLNLQAGFYRDPVLKNVTYTLLTYSEQFFTIGVGPFFGLFNSSGSLLSPGISTLIKLDLPGLLFVKFRSDSSIGSRLVREGDYLQERSDLTAGVYVLNAIASANLFTKSFTHITAEDEVIDSFVEYSFRTDIYQKNVPYKVILSFAYQTRSKSFTDNITRATVLLELNSIILGTRIDMQVTDYLSVMTNLESSIYSFGSAGASLLTLLATGINAYLFNVTAGFTLSVDRLMARDDLG
ncbi:MAG: hypothetical protein HN368_14230 [Spirochaetales bacterium]|nr:hypothetical protein [Spirochaetales bacterium]